VYHEAFLQGLKPAFGKGLYSQQRYYLPKRSTLTKEVPLSCRFGAKLGSAVLLACLILLAAANFIGAPLWAITLAAAAALVAGNWWQHYLRPWWLRRRKGRRRHQVCGSEPDCFVQA